MKKVMNILIFALFATSLFAQREETIIGDAGWGFSGAWGGWGSSIGSFNKNYSGYSGTLWSLEFGKRLNIGFSHYDISNQPISVVNNFSLKSRNLLLSYTPMSYRAFHPIISLATGTGKLRATGEAGEDRVFTVHPAAGLELNVTRWCHIDAQVGYRFVTDSDFTAFKDADFSGVFGLVNLKFGFSWGRYRTTNSKRDN